MLLNLLTVNNLLLNMTYSMQSVQSYTLEPSNLVGGLMRPVWMIKFYNNKTVELLIQEEWPLSKGQARNPSILSLQLIKSWASLVSEEKILEINGSKERPPFG